MSVGITIAPEIQFIKGSAICFWKNHDNSSYQQQQNDYVTFDTLTIPQFSEDELLAMTEWITVTFELLIENPPPLLRPELEVLWIISDLLISKLLCEQIIPPTALS